MTKSIGIAAVLACLSRLALADPVEDYFGGRGPLPTYSDLSSGPLNDFSIFRPENPGENGVLHPVITWGNGTLTVPLFYFGFLDHLASHGFVVIASNKLFTGSGEAMLDGVDWIIEQNADPSSPLFGTIDVDSIGATGHSQGGGGAINAGNDPRIDCTAPMQPTPANVEGLHGPMFVISGQNDTIVPLRRVYRSTWRPSMVPTTFGIHDNATHFEPLGNSGRFRGYVTAWFAACLNDDEFARSAFAEDCSFCENENWRVFQKE